MILWVGVAKVGFLLYPLRKSPHSTVIVLGGITVLNPSHGYLDLTSMGVLNTLAFLMTVLDTLSSSPSPSPSPTSHIPPTPCVPGGRILQACIGFPDFGTLLEFGLMALFLYIAARASWGMSTVFSHGRCERRDVLELVEVLKAIRRSLDDFKRVDWQDVGKKGVRKEDKGNNERQRLMAHVNRIRRK